MWHRPENVKYPQIWHRFQGRKPLPDGTFPFFRVQDIPPKMFEEVADFMTTDFLKNEPLCKDTGIADDPVGVAKYRNLVLKSLQSKVGLVCFMEDPSKLQGINPEIVGTNITTICTQDDPEEILTDDAYSQVLRSVVICNKYVNVYKKYGVREYMTAMGLSVAPKYKGQNIGAEILRARIPLCRAVGIKVTVTTFSAIESQTLAKKVGFEILAEISIDELRRKGVRLGETIKIPIKLMALQID